MLNNDMSHREKLNKIENVKKNIKKVELFFNTMNVVQIIMKLNINNE